MILIHRNLKKEGEERVPILKLKYLLSLRGIMEEQMQLHKDFPQIRTKMIMRK
jgi:hypothetical protein